MSGAPSVPKFASIARLFCIRFTPQPHRRRRANDPGYRGGAQGRDAMNRRSVLAGLGATAAAGAFGMPSILRAQATISLNGAVQFNDDHALHQGADPVRRAGAEILRQTRQFHAAQELLAWPREAVFRIHVAGQGRRLRHRLAGPHVDLRQGGSVHRCSIRVQGHRAHEQGRRTEHPGADRRRGRCEGRESC